MAQPLSRQLASIAEALISQQLREQPSRLATRRALCLAMGMYGLRGQEVCNLARRDHDSRRSTIRVLTIKRGYPRTLEVDPFITHVLNRFGTSTASNAPLIPSPKGKHLDAQCVRRYAGWLSRQLGTRYTFHSLRHTAAIRTYEATRDVYAVHKLLGHRTLMQTHVYLQTTVAVSSSVGPNWHHTAAAPELHAYTGPLSDDQRRVAFTRHLVSGRVPPAKPALNSRRANASTWIDKLEGMPLANREAIIQALILHTWPQPDDPIERRGRNKKGNMKT